MMGIDVCNSVVLRTFAELSDDHRRTERGVSMVEDTSQTRLSSFRIGSIDTATAYLFFLR